MYIYAGLEPTTRSMLSQVAGRNDTSTYKYVVPYTQIQWLAASSEDQRLKSTFTQHIDRMYVSAGALFSNPVIPSNSQNLRPGTSF